MWATIIKTAWSIIKTAAKNHAKSKALSGLFDALKYFIISFVVLLLLAISAFLSWFPSFLCSIPFNLFCNKNEEYYYQLIDNGQYKDFGERLNELRNDIASNYGGDRLKVYEVEMEKADSDEPEIIEIPEGELFARAILNVDKIILGNLDLNNDAFESGHYPKDSNLYRTWLLVKKLRAALFALGNETSDETEKSKGIAVVAESLLKERGKDSENPLRFEDTGKEGFINMVLKEAGFSEIASKMQNQLEDRDGGKKIKKFEDLERGDLIFFGYTDMEPMCQPNQLGQMPIGSHCYRDIPVVNDVGIYLGNHKFIHMSGSVTKMIAKVDIKKSEHFNESDFMGGKRFIPEAQDIDTKLLNQQELLDLVKKIDKRGNYTKEDMFTIIRYQILRCYLVGENDIGGFFGLSATPCKFLDSLNEGKEFIPKEDREQVSMTGTFKYEQVKCVDSASETETKQTSSNTQVKLNNALATKSNYNLIQTANEKGFIPELSDGVFPLPSGQYDKYGNSWGANRQGGARTHEGTDIMSPMKTPLYSATDGKITKMGWNRIGGYRINIETNGYMLYYAHIDSYAPGISQGMDVKKGQLIAYVGDTGSQSGGPEGTRGQFDPHLHFGIYKNGTAINSYANLKHWEAGGGFVPGTGGGGGGSGSEILVKSTVKCGKDQKAEITGYTTSTGLKHSSKNDILFSFVNYSLYEPGVTISDNMMPYKELVIESLREVFKIYGLEEEFENFLNPPSSSFGLGGWIVPMEVGTYNFSSDYGCRAIFKSKRNDLDLTCPSNQPDFHEGIDLGTSQKHHVPIYNAGGPGIVLAAQCGLSGFGCAISIKHHDGSATEYGHMLAGDYMLVKAGWEVVPGQLIAGVGNGGGVPPHLHFNYCLTNSATYSAFRCKPKFDDPESVVTPVQAQNQELQKQRAKEYKKWYGEIYASSDPEKEAQKYLMPGYTPTAVSGPVVVTNLMGILAGKYESDFDPGACNPKILACGVWQFNSAGSSTALPNFINNHLKSQNVEMYNELSRYSFGTQEFGNAWRKVSDQNPSLFMQLQWSFAKPVFYDKCNNEIFKQTGINISSRHVAVQEAMFSACLHIGEGGTPIMFKNLFGKNSTNMSDRDMVHKIYEGVKKKYPKENRYKHNLELNDALLILDGHPVNPKK